MAFKYPEYNAFVDRHVSPSEIGRSLGLDEKTVRTRVKKMEDDRFIKYYQAIPNLALFGLKSIGLYNFEADDIYSKHQALGHVRQAPMVVEGIDFLGSAFFVSLAGASLQEVQQQGDEMAKKLRLKAGVKIGDRITRDPVSQPDKLDWQIIQRLRYHAHCPTNSVADALSITPRMAEYRINRLLESGALLVRAIIDAQKQQGLIFYELVMSVEEARQPLIVKEVKDMFSEKFWSTYTPAPGVVLASLFGFTSGEPEEAVMNALKLKGVKRCSLYILKEIIEPHNPNWIDNLIEGRIARVGHK